jgi:hypothetical protein
MNATLLPTATDRDASAPGSVQSMPMSAMPSMSTSVSKWSKPRNLTGATDRTFCTNHCTFTGIYGAKRVATGSLPEGLT